MNNLAIMQGEPYTSGMSAALGAYLKTLREGRELAPKTVLAELSKRLKKTVAHSRLWRAENGDADRWPDGDFLTALLDILGADLADVAWIQQNTEATAADGERRAQNRLNHREEAIVAELLSSDEDQLNLIRSVLSLTNDPVLQGRLRGYLDALQSGRE